MYQRILFRIKSTDEISKLTMMRPETIETLKRAHIEIVGDLLQASIRKITGISAAEEDKLDEVCRFLRDTPDGLHG